MSLAAAVRGILALQQTRCGGNSTCSDVDYIVKTFAADKDMLWGSATASYQVEGAWNESGRQPTIWDDWLHSRTTQHSGDTGDVADDFYHLWPEDIERMHRIGFNSFRLSIAWSRVLPNDKPNPAGIHFYMSLLTRLRMYGIEPLVTLYHWDLPNDKDWLDPSIVQQFAHYADFCFRTFGHLVAHWLTFNEPWVFCGAGYGSDGFPPGKNSEAAKYRCGHHVLLSHAAAVKLYRHSYQYVQRGAIGITLNYDWAEPYDTASEGDAEAAQLHHDFNLGWFADPVYLTGDYPASMRRMLGKVLPEFTREERRSLRGSFDFYGMNHYTTCWVKAKPGLVPPLVTTNYRDDGTAIGLRGQSEWLFVVPWGIERVLRYVHGRYPAVKRLLITENGVDVKDESSMPFPEVLNDTVRVKYYTDYLTHVANAKQLGVPVKGYFAWSLLDNLEWTSGFDMRFGLHYVNFTAVPPSRHAKASANWFAMLMQRLDAAKHRVEDAERRDVMHA